MFFCYIVVSKSTGRYYIGSTHDLANRLREHNGGEGKNTRGGIPWEIVWSEEFVSRSGAMDREKQVKGRGAGRFLEDLERMQAG